jgi:methionyl-tRNA synthetase
MNQLIQTTGQFDAWLKANPILAGIFLVWIMVWKGLALWKAAKKNQIPWFIAILIINMGGILEILYFFIFSERKFGKKKNIIDEEKEKSSNN